MIHTNLNVVALLAFHRRLNLIGAQETIRSAGITPFSVCGGRQFLNIRQAVQGTAKIGFPSLGLRLIPILENTWQKQERKMGSPVNKTSFILYHSHILYICQDVGKTDGQTELSHLLLHVRITLGMSLQ